METIGKPFVGCGIDLETALQVLEDGIDTRSPKQVAIQLLDKCIQDIGAENLARLVVLKNDNWDINAAEFHCQFPNLKISVGLILKVNSIE